MPFLDFRTCISPEFGRLIKFAGFLPIQVNIPLLTPNVGFLAAGYFINLYYFCFYLIFPYGSNGRP